MKDRLHTIWKLAGWIEIMDNDNGLYLVKFDQATNKENVILEGPWMLFYHYLAVSHWTLEFALPDAKVDGTIIKIRFQCLNLVYYDERFLHAMTLIVRRPIKVDNNTMKVEHGKFYRVRV